MDLELGGVVDEVEVASLADAVDLPFVAAARVDRSFRVPRQGPEIGIGGGGNGGEGGAETDHAVGSQGDPLQLPRFALRARPVLPYLRGCPPGGESESPQDRRQQTDRALPPQRHALSSASRTVSEPERRCGDRRSARNRWIAQPPAPAAPGRSILRRNGGRCSG